VERGVAISAAELAGWVRDSRLRSSILLADLSDEQWLGPRLPIVNPPLWELGHVAWFQEYWVLRTACGAKALRADGDQLYDSSAVPHALRWDLPLPSRPETLAYAAAVQERVLERLGRGTPDPRLRYFVQLAVFHEDMHGEAFWYTRQTHGYPAPPCGAPPRTARDESPPPTGDAELAGGRFELGARPGEPFAFDNEKWAHPVELEPFAIARTPVTLGEFAGFVADGGYGRRELWSESGWRWRSELGAETPVYWRAAAGGRFEHRVFDRWLPLEADLPMLHVSWHEAQAYCRWAGRRLPTEAEWEAAASLDTPGSGKRRHPWGEVPPGPGHAALDGRLAGPAPVGAFAAGDSAGGCRQLVGGVWEWTASAFAPYPGFAPDPYRDYSQPWFHTHKVLRGGCFATRGRLLRNTWRNFYPPERRDVWAGFRTCRSDGSRPGPE
jgi:iron(II)-dependent oxidoreductase